MPVATITVPTSRSQNLVLDVEVDALLVARLEALAAGDRIEAETVVGVEEVGGGNGLGERQVDRLAGGEPLLVFVGNDHRADLAAVGARSALDGVDVGGALADPGLVVAHEARDVFDLAIDQKLYAWMPTGIHHFRAENSYRAVHRRERLVECRHDPSDGRTLFDQIDLVVSVGQLQRRLDPGHPAADHQSGVGDRERLLVLGPKPAGSIDGAVAPGPWPWRSPPPCPSCGPNCSARGCWPSPSDRD